jgi:hypothetical protein
MSAAVCTVNCQAAVRVGILLLCTRMLLLAGCLGSRCLLKQLLCTSPVPAKVCMPHFPVLPAKGHLAACIRTCVAGISVAQCCLSARVFQCGQHMCRIPVCRPVLSVFCEDCWQQVFAAPACVRGRHPGYGCGCCPCKACLQWFYQAFPLPSPTLSSL